MKTFVGAEIVGGTRERCFGERSLGSLGRGRCRNRHRRLLRSLTGVSEDRSTSGRTQPNERRAGMRDWAARQDVCSSCVRFSAEFLWSQMSPLPLDVLIELHLRLRLGERSVGRIQLGRSILPYRRSTCRGDDWRACRLADAGEDALDWATIECLLFVGLLPLRF